MITKNILVLVAYGIPNLAPVRRILSINSYAGMRLGRMRYEDLLTKFWTGSPVITMEALPGSVGELRTVLQHHPEATRVLAVDARWFPINEEQVHSLIEKAKYASVDVIVHAFGGNAPALWASDTAPLLTRNDIERIDHAMGDPVRLKAPDGAYADLSDPARILRLFASGFSLRAFNKMGQGRSGYFMKSSPQKDKMLAEHTFFTNIPAEIRPFFPQVGTFTETADGGSYEVEVVPALDVAKHLLNETFRQPVAAERLIDSLSRYWDARPRVQTTSAQVRSHLTDLFVRKTSERIANTKALPIIGKLNLVCQWNGVESYEEFSHSVINKVKSTIESEASTSLGFFHGDLFFSNMIFDPSTGLLKLIDPRGTKSGTASFNADWYDLAKLSHSFCGRYDTLVYDLADLVLGKEMQLTLRHHDLPGLATLQHGFERFLSDRGYNLGIVRLYESTLFLSMIPLHAEDDKRVVCQLCQAIDSFKAAK